MSTSWVFANSMITEIGEINGTSFDAKSDSGLVNR